jgi:tetratricopeptide (TPR) repeat protein/transcriptional regulator with XRE-family HTH domain
MHQQERKPGPNLLLREARLRKRWTLTVASKKVGVSYSTYANWEVGLQEPLLSSLDLLCLAFEKTPDQLGYAHLVEVPELKMKVAQERTPLPMTHALAADSPTLLEIAALACELVQQQEGWTLEECLAQFESVKRRVTVMEQPSMSNEKLSRRRTLTLLAGLPIALLSLSPDGQNAPVYAEELLPLCSTAIPACWDLYFDGGLAEVQKVLPVYCTRLEALAQQASSHQKQAAGLVSQAYQLASNLAKQQEDYGAALAHCQQAIIYSRLSGDPNLQVAALIRKADVYYEKRYPLHSQQAQQLYEETLPLLKDATPLLQGRVYTRLAEIYAKQGQKQEALRYMGMAQDVFPAYPKDDPAFAYTGHSHFTLYVHGEGLTYLALHQPEKARQALAKVEGLLPKTIGVRQVALRVHQAEVAVAANDLEESCTHLRVAALTAQQIGTHLYRNQALEVYQRLPASWRSEQAIRELGKIFAE